MSNNSIGAVEAQGDLTIRDAAALAAALLEAIRSDEEVVLDASGLVTCDVSILQVLVAAHRTAQKLGHVFRVTGARAGGLGDVMTSSGIMAAQDTPIILDGDTWTGLGQQRSESAA